MDSTSALVGLLNDTNNAVWALVGAIMVLVAVNFLLFFVTVFYYIRIYDITHRYIEDVLKHINSDK